jgi:hypothetical protein
MISSLDTKAPRLLSVWHGRAFDINNANYELGHFTLRTFGDSLPRLVKLKFYHVKYLHFVQTLGRRCEKGLKRYQNVLVSLYSDGSVLICLTGNLTKPEAQLMR